MLVLFAPIVASYMLFVLTGENLNPLGNPRELSARQKIRSGKNIALASLPIFYGLAFTSYFLTAG